MTNTLMAKQLWKSLSYVNQKSPSFTPARMAKIRIIFLGARVDFYGRARLEDEFSYKNIYIHPHTYKYDIILNKLFI